MPAYAQEIMGTPEFRASEHGVGLGTRGFLEENQRRICHGSHMRVRSFSSQMGGFWVAGVITERMLIKPLENWDILGQVSFCGLWWNSPGRGRHGLKCEEMVETKRWHLGESCHGV